MLEILLLQQNGNLSLEDSAVKYIPHLNISPAITLEMLASQMSGLGRDRTINPLPRDLDLSKYVPGSCGREGFTCTPEEFHRILGSHPAVFEPETQPSYSNDAFGLLGEIIVSIYGIQILKVKGG